MITENLNSRQPCVYVLPITHQLYELWSIDQQKSLRFICCVTDDVIVEDDDDTDDDDMYPGRCMRMNFDGHHGNSNTGSGSPQGRRYRKNSRHDSQRSRYHYQRYYRRQPHQTQTRGTIPTPSGAPQDATQSAFNVPHACVSPPVNETELPSGGAAVNSKSSK